jgi:hypothetical protein
MPSLDDLKILLRQRLGEPQIGAISNSVAYTDPTRTVDELLDFINRAQKKVAEDTISQGHSILQGRTKIAVEPDIYEYALPSDFISVLELYQYHATTFYRVDQHPLSGLRTHFTPGSTAAIYTHFDVYGVTAEILDEGVVTSTSISNTVFTDALASFSASGDTGISANVDLVYNLTDDSVGTITSLTSTTLTASSGLAGGKTNMWQQGDRYQVQRGNETLQVLNMYPPVSAGDTENIVSETDATAVSAAYGTFSLTDEAVLYSVQAYIASTVTGPVSVTIRDNGSGAVLSRAAFDSASTSAYNEAVFEYSYRLAKSTTYRVQLTDGANTNIPFLSTAAFTKFKVNGYTGNEYLDLYYARYPKPYSTSFTGSCEIPEWGIEAVVLYAEYMALLKISGGRNNMATQALNDYKGEVANILRQRGLRSRNRVTVVGDVITGGARIPTIKNVPITTKLPLG